MITSYTHLELGKEIEIGVVGHYTPEKEIRLQRDGKEVLYVIGKAVVESSCCGNGSWTYALVPGYVVDWQTRNNRSGRPVSEVEPIQDSDLRDELRQTIKTSEGASLIEFW